MTGVGISTRVFVRDEIGRFSSEIERRTGDALEEIGTRGASTARRMIADVPGIARTIRPQKVSATSVLWLTDHPWWEGFEEGIPKHEIAVRAPGVEGEPQALFGREGERGRAERFGPVPLHAQPVRHPGWRARHFLARSYEVVSKAAGSILAKHTARG